MSKNKKRTESSIGKLGKLYIALLLIVFGGIVLHAPLSVAFSTIFPSYELIIKSWKEILIIISAVLLIVILSRKRQFSLLKDPILLVIGAYIALHLVTALFTLGSGGSLLSVAGGLLIDLRYVMYFALIYAGLLLFPSQRKNFLIVFMFGASVVMVFAILQVFVLPVDILSHIGYGHNTIEPYLTVDKNTDYIRINSTLRGPNPLGAYAVIVLGFIAAAIAKKKIPPMTQSKVMAVILVVGGSVALWASYSRSALVAGTGAVVIAVVVSLYHKLRLRAWIAIALGITIIGSIFLVINHNSTFVSNVLLHENPYGGSAVTSNDGHVTSLQDGVNQTIKEPLGIGIGSSGSPSLLGDSPLIIENSYLYVAHEVGWLGLILFVAIFVMVMIRLWKGRMSYVSLGVFASGIGIAGIALLLPIWADDTVSLVWWGLAGVALAGAKK